MLSVLGPEASQRLKAHARTRVLGPSETLFSEGQVADTFYFVVEGRVKLVAVAEHGRETILELCSPGSAVCIPAPSMGHRHCCSAVAMSSGTQVAAIAREDLLRVLQEGNPLAGEILLEVTKRCMSMCQRVVEMGAGQVEQRLARLLLDLAARNGETDGDPELCPIPPSSMHIPIKLTRQDLADLCGTSLETAIRIMSRWTKAHLIKRSGQGLVVLDPDALARVCRQPVRGGRSDGPVTPPSTDS